MILSGEWITWRQLVRRDAYVALQQMRQFVLEGALLTGCFYLMYCKFLPHMGFSPDLIPALFIGMMISSSLSMLFGTVQQIALDIDRQRVIDYLRTLPLSTALHVLRLIVSTTLAVLMCLLPLVLIGMLVFNQFIDFSRGSLIQVLMVLTLLLGVLSALAIAVVFRVSYHWFRDYMWIFCLTPLLFLGCELVPWRSAWQIAPRIALLCLANPVTYGLEGLRRAATGHELYLSLWYCVPMLVIWSVLLYWIAYRAYRQRMGEL